LRKKNSSKKKMITHMGKKILENKEVNDTNQVVDIKKSGLVKREISKGGVVKIEIANEIVNEELIKMEQNNIEKLTSQHPRM